VLLTGANLVLLDEPAAGLSPEERNELSSLLVRLRDSGKTIVLVEHDLDLVWRTADAIIVMEAGRIIANGRPDELRKDERVRKLFTTSAHA